MLNRREILRATARFLTGLSVYAATGWSRVVVGATAIKKRVLPKGTDPQTLSNQNPEFLDTRNLKVMPLEAFETMGDKTAPFNRDIWRLDVTGTVQVPVKITYADVLRLPVLQREVLLVCPGVFANHGRWKGFSVKELIKMTGLTNRTTKVIFRGHSRLGERTELFTLEEITNDKVFLAYAVNDVMLPVKHGCPLRVVAEGHWGSEWVKYVYGVDFQ